MATLSRLLRRGACFGSNSRINHTRRATHSGQRKSGLVTLLDGAYDGHEAVTGSVLCSPPSQAFACGGKSANYGDVITPVRNATLFWILH